MRFGVGIPAAGPEASRDTVLSVLHVADRLGYDTASRPRYVGE
jgi:hypothetical protein